MKPETNFKNAIHKLLDRSIHRQSNTYGMSNGTPDMYYDGVFCDAWVEYKWLPSMPRSGIVIGTYSPLQLRWMKRRYKACVEGGLVPNVIGMIGLPNKLVVVQIDPEEWDNGTPIDLSMTRADAAQFITDMVNT